MTTIHKRNQGSFGEIPQDWEIVRLGKAIRTTKGRKPNSLLDEKIESSLPYLTAEYMRNNSTARVQYCKNDDPNIVRVGENEVIMIWDGSNSGDVFLGFEGALASTMVKIETNEKIDDCYLFYFLKKNFNYLSGTTSGTGIPHISKTVFRNLQIPLPPIFEQQKISAVLSSVGNAIQLVDEAIAKTERLKKGLVHKLLKEGIGHKEFKQTKIGRIPKTWKIERLSDYADVRYGLGQPTALDPDGVPMIRATNVKKGKIIETDIICLEKSQIPSNRNLFLIEGEIIVVRSGVYTGDVAIVTKKWEGAVAGYDLVVSPHQEIDPFFLTYWFLSPQIQNRYFYGLKTRSAQPHLNAKQIERTPIPVPSLEEQKMIGDIISAVDDKIELEKMRREKIERLKHGLMNDLLTGKRRVKVAM